MRSGESRFFLRLQGPLAATIELNDPTLIELETRMLHLQPNELLLQKDLSPATDSIVKHLAGRFKCD